MKLHLSFRCPMDWAAMSGDDTTRHCAACDRDVHNLSNLTPEAARALLERTTGANLCVRAEVGREGQVRFARAAATAALLAATPAMADVAIPLPRPGDTAVLPSEPTANTPEDGAPQDATDVDCVKVQADASNGEHHAPTTEDGDTVDGDTDYPDIMMGMYVEIPPTALPATPPQAAGDAPPDSEAPAPEEAG